MPSYLEWEIGKWQNDIALAKFDKPIQFSTRINPVCLPSSSFQDEGDVGFMVGSKKGLTASCTTNGGGPERYKKCTGFLETDFQRIFVNNGSSHGCHYGPSPSGSRGTRQKICRDHYNTFVLQANGSIKEEVQHLILN